MAVGNDEGTAALDELGEIGVVVLGAGEHDLAAPGRLLVGFALLHFLGGVAQHGENEVLRADEGAQLDDLELITRDGRVVELAVAADLLDELADLVVLLDSLADGLVGGVDAELLVQRIQNVILKLRDEVIDSVLGLLERDVGEVHEEVRVLDDVHVTQVLLEAAGDGAGLSRHLGVKEVVAALERALEEAAAVVAYTTGQIVGRDVGRGAFRRSQTHGKTSGQIEQNFRHEIAGVTQRFQALLLCLTDQLVVGLLQKVFKCDQVFQVSHVQAPLKFFAFKKQTFNNVMQQLSPYHLTHFENSRFVVNCQTKCWFFRSRIW